MPIKFQPCVSIYKAIRTGVYFVQPYTIGPVASTQFGDPTVIQPDEFDALMAGAVVTNLEKFGKERFDPAKAKTRSVGQQRQFIKDHLGVTVELLESGSMMIGALHREGGGMVGSDEDTFILSKEETPQKLVPTIAEAFNRAT